MCAPRGRSQNAFGINGPRHSRVPTFFLENRGRPLTGFGIPAFESTFSSKLKNLRSDVFFHLLSWGFISKGSVVIIFRKREKKVI